MINLFSILKLIITLLKNIFTGLNQFVFKSINENLAHINLITSVVFIFCAVAQAQNSNKAESKNTTTISNELIRVNKKVSEKIEQTAEAIDKSVTPTTQKAKEPNKTQIYFKVGADIVDNGESESLFRFGARLHLPRFEQYWALKFENQDEKQERGRSTLDRERRTRNPGDEVFVGLSLLRNWEKLKFQYEPKISIDNRVGLDHSLEVFSEYKSNKFTILPSLEFFAVNEDGTGTSSELKFIFQITKKFSFEQGNDSRYLFLTSKLFLNHYVGFNYFISDLTQVSIQYYRSFLKHYFLNSYGTYLNIRHKLYENVLSLELSPYIIYEEETQFHQTNGFILNFKLNF